MSGELMIILELGLVFMLAFGWGFKELNEHRKYKQRRDHKNKQK